MFISLTIPYKLFNLLDHSLPNDSPTFLYYSIGIIYLHYIYCAVDGAMHPELSAIFILDHSLPYNVFCYPSP